MERFVFVMAIVVAAIFAVGAVIGESNWSFELGEDGGGPAPIVDLAPGEMEAAQFTGDRLRVRYTVARITITPEDRSDFLVSIQNPGGAPMPTVSASDGRVLIDGNLRGRISRCTEGGGAELRGYAAVTPETMPHIVIRAPRTLDLTVNGANVTEIGAAQTLEIDQSGCGVTTAGDVQGELNVDLAGSGAVNAGVVQTLEADLAGSGEINVSEVAQRANVDIAGSGAVAIARLNGELDANNAGSGNLFVRGGAVTQADVDLAGSGGATISAPVTRLNASIVGSGDVVVEGDVGDIDAEIAGSGGVRAWAVTGQIQRRILGSGEVQVGR
ncbi:MAG: DUF2807 domain-containing protein [Hyphomonadaceae bacterium]|nr:DUF2807 domain-containing protein [Hyphomonadaceae bacterium]